MTVDTVHVCEITVHECLDAVECAGCDAVVDKEPGKMSGPFIPGEIGDWARLDGEEGVSKNDGGINFHIDRGKHSLIVVVSYDDGRSVSVGSNWDCW